MTKINGELGVQHAPQWVNHFSPGHSCGVMRYENEYYELQLTYPPALDVLHKQVRVFVLFLGARIRVFQRVRASNNSKHQHPSVCACIELSAVFGRFDVSVPGWGIEMPLCLI